MLINEIEKIKGQLGKKNIIKVNQVNSSNPWSRSWNWDNLVKSKLKRNHEAQSLINLMLKYEIKTKQSIKKRMQKKKLESTWVNMLNSWPDS
jgi:hypothetical protein